MQKYFAYGDMPEKQPKNIKITGESVNVRADPGTGGRVLGVTATAPTLKEALCAAYAKAEKISFENAFYRRDIGLKALNAGKEN